MHIHFNTQQGADMDPLPMTLESIGMAYALNCKERLEIGLPLLDPPELDQRQVDKLELTRMVCTYGRPTVELWIKNIAAVAALGGTVNGRKDWTVGCGSGDGPYGVRSGCCPS